MWSGILLEELSMQVFYCSLDFPLFKNMWYKGREVRGYFADTYKWGRWSWECPYGTLPNNPINQENKISDKPWCKSTNPSLFMVLSWMRSCFVCLCPKMWRLRLCVFRKSTKMCGSSGFNYNEVHCGMTTMYLLYFGKQCVVMFAFRSCLRSDGVHCVPNIMELDYPVKIVEVLWNFWAWASLPSRFWSVTAFSCWVTSKSHSWYMGAYVGSVVC